MIKIISILHNIGYIQYRQKYFVDAAKTYKKSLRGIDSSSESCKIELAATFNCLGVIEYRKMDKNGGVNSCCNKGIEILQS